MVLWWLTDDPTLSEEFKARLDDEPDAHIQKYDVAILSV